MKNICILSFFKITYFFEYKLMITAELDFHSIFIYGERMSAKNTILIKNEPLSRDSVVFSTLLPQQLTKKEAHFSPEQTIEYFGTVNYATNDRVLGMIREKYSGFPKGELCLIVTSTGGPTGTAMSFYDTIRSVWGLDITTIGSGDVDSSGILIFLSGKNRYVTKHTTLLLHLAGRIFEPGKRFTREEIEAMTTEDRIKDEQYASVIAEHAVGLSLNDVLQMMKNNTILIPSDLVRYGLAKAIL
jgi:ATP-dependent protease ClpP protease subunit